MWHVRKNERRVNKVRNVRKVGCVRKSEKNMRKSDLGEKKMRNVRYGEICEKK